jgi:hypothetical protein
MNHYDNLFHPYSSHPMETNAAAQTSLYKSLIKFVSETKDIHADSVNPFHKSKYASLAKHLEVLKPLAAKHGLAIVQFPIGFDNSVGVRTIIIHEEGGVLSSDAVIPCESGMKGQDAGALYSYIRRYALAAVSGCATDDDDAELDRQIKSAPAKSAPAPKAASVTKGTGVFAAPAAAPAAGSGDILVPFGDRKGQPLSSLPLVETDRSVKFGDLTYFAKRWTPKPYGDNPNPSARDLKVKAEAERLFKAATEGATAEPVDDVPFDTNPF